MEIILHDHQKKAVDLLSNGKILRGDPGVGKSFAALGYYWTKVLGGVMNDWDSIKTPKHIFIFTTAKKRNDGDWQRDCYHMGLMEDPEISVAGIKVTVDSWNNIENYVDVEDAFVIFDEHKAMGSGVWARTFMKLTKKNDWIILSATPGDVWLDYVPVFIANGFYKNRTEFKDRHVVYASWTKFPKIERYINVNELVRHKNAVLVEMVYTRHTTRHLTLVDVNYDESDMEKVAKNRWHIFEDRPIRDVGELFAVSRRVANSDPDRISAIKALQKKHKRLIVFYNFDYELELLRSLANGSPESRMSDVEETLETPTQELSPASESGSRREAAKERMLTKAGERPRTTFNNTGMHSHPSTNSTETLSVVRKSMNSSGVTFENGAVVKNSPTPGSFSMHVVPEDPDSSTSPNNSSVSVSSLDDGLETSHVWEGVTVAEWNGHKHQPVPTTDEWIYLVQYRAGAEAWNCTTTDAMAFYSMTYSYKDFEQSQGRIDRLNTKYSDLWYYLLISEAWIDKAIKKSIDDKKDFNEKRHRIYSDADLGIKEAA